MHRSHYLIGLCLVAAAIAHHQAAAEEMAFWITFDQTKIEPNAKLDGEVVVEGCRLLDVTGVLFEKGESVEGAKWQCAMEGTKQAPGTRRMINHMPRNKGLVVRVDGGGTVRLKTALGDVAFATGDIGAAKAKPFLDGKVLVLHGPSAERLSSTETQDEYPGIACDAEGRVWVAWQSWDASADSLLYAVRDLRGWSKPTKLVPYTGDFYRVQVAGDGAGGNRAPAPPRS